MLELTSGIKKNTKIDEQKKMEPKTASRASVSRGERQSRLNGGGASDAVEDSLKYVLAPTLVRATGMMRTTAKVQSHCHICAGTGQRRGLASKSSGGRAAYEAEGHRDHLEAHGEDLGDEGERDLSERGAEVSNAVKEGRPKKTHRVPSEAVPGGVEEDCENGHVVTSSATAVGAVTRSNLRVKRALTRLSARRQAGKAAYPEQVTTNEEKTERANETSNPVRKKKISRGLRASGKQLTSEGGDDRDDRR